MPQTSPLIHLCLFQSMSHKTPTTYFQKYQYAAKLSYIGAYKNFPEVPKDKNNKRTSNMDDEPRMNDRHQEILLSNSLPHK